VLTNSWPAAAGGPVALEQWAFLPPPACGWVRGICGKPQVKCGECPNQAFVPFGDDIIRSHLTGKAAGNAAEFTAGIYPMLPDETCCFLAADFDKKSWKRDVVAFRDTARAKGVPVAIERSRSGNGAHAWIFFEEPIRITSVVPRSRR